MQEYLSFELFVHYKCFFLVNHCQSPRQGIKKAEENFAGCKNIKKYVCLKCDAFACIRSLKCSVPPSEKYPGWKECINLALSFKCNEEHATDYQQQDSSDEKENKEAGTSDVELVIHCNLRFHEYRKIWTPKFEKN